MDCMIIWYFIYGCFTMACCSTCKHPLWIPWNGKGWKLWLLGRGRVVLSGAG